MTDTGEDVTPNDPAAAPDDPVTAPFVGVDVGEWSDLIERGRARGVLHAEEITHVLRQVELSGDVLAQVQVELAAERITIDESVDELVGEAAGAEPLSGTGGRFDV